jgi:putative ABC transport system permease protein
MHAHQLRKLSVRILLTLGFRSVIACAVLGAGTAGLITNVAVTAAARQHAELSFGRYDAQYVYVLPVVIRKKNAKPATTSPGLPPYQVRIVQSVPDCLWSGVEQRNTTVASPSHKSETAVAGVDAAYFDIRGLEAAEGRLFHAEEDRALSRVAVLSSTTARELFPAEPSLGKTIRISGVPFNVIGVLAASGTDLEGHDLDSVIFIPRKTAAVRLFGSSQIDMIIARGGEDESAPSLAARITEQIRNDRHRGGSGISVKLPEAVVNMGSRTATVYNNWTLGSAIIGMIAGGIGIITIMLITVKERGAEIAVRRALGATRSAILRQFVFETTCLVVAGIAAGVLAGVALGIGISSAAYGIRTFPWASLRYAAFPAAFGILAGLIPSWIAARLNIVRALAG